MLVNRLCNSLGSEDHNYNAEAISNDTDDDTHQAKKMCWKKRRYVRQKLFMRITREHGRVDLSWYNEIEKHPPNAQMD